MDGKMGGLVDNMYVSAVLSLSIVSVHTSDNIEEII